MIKRTAKLRTEMPKTVKLLAAKMIVVNLIAINLIAVKLKTVKQWRANQRLNKPLRKRHLQRGGRL